ncbi:alkaline phosphatase family protein [Undibacterium sp. RTI2.1]|uniref:alkaline phosphatase family protein n=1 Tax=unclassified Undibacterium TaxID=2630295 RepID=UPI002B2313DA|nr:MULTISPECIES: alkaline phosphatase family protein [unclassified Undibacterium]MEB0031115.1 alkaline phosphatase family protein [Undibacterium sp. RTI2.1]MEB0115294.1 alkaline phosphatase family protein [Undibacterium sp. RTI2.2]
MRQSVLVLSLATVLASLAGCGGSSNVASTPTTTAPVAAPVQRTIIMVWDGLRPDSVNPTDTPNLYALRQQGVQFADHHSTYPTFTMMNGSSFATGSFPKTSGFYGNTFWTPPQAGAAQPIPVGKSAAGAAQDYQDPVFTEDYAVLSTLNDYYGGQLLLVKTLFKTAQDAGLKTATIGKSGAAFIQDLRRGGIFLDENAVLPQSLVTDLQAANYALPLNTTFAYPAGTVTLSATNGNPTARAGALTFALPNGLQAKDATDTTQGNPEDAANKYMMNIYTSFILPKKLPDLSLIWFRTPDNTEHAYGPGSANYRKALASQDARLGELQAGLKAAGLDTTTNIIVVSDHAHSNVSGPTSLFPLRAINASTTVTSGVTNATLGAKDSVAGFSVSGDVRTADLLTFAGFKAFDGNGCSTSAMYGIKSDGSNVYNVGVDTTGTLCGTANAKYQAISATLATPVASFKVPATLPANGIVIAANGGSDYLYMPDHDLTTVTNVVRFLQSREEYGAIFVDSRYGAIPGTLPMAMINLENSVRSSKGQPDVVVSFNWDSQQLVNGLPGIEFESTGGNRGMHGSFSPIDVHNTLIANGPAFRSGITISTPTGNVDVAPTVAYILGQSMPQADGRVLSEALLKPATTSSLVVKPSILNPTTPSTGLTFKLPTDPTGVTIDTAYSNGSYSVNLVVKDLTIDGKTYRYFDYAQAVRN